MSSEAARGERLDIALTRDGLARSRSQATELIRTGHVRVDGRTVTKTATKVGSGQRLGVDQDPWVSRGSHKLLGALDESGLAVPPVVLDAGASTGGFSQVLLERGARLVHAVDVGHGQLAPRLRADPRVHDLEGHNLRDLDLAMLGGEPVGLAVGDVSFISLTLLLEPIFSVIGPGGRALLLVKPQFEVGRRRLGAGGVVRDPADRRWAVDHVLVAAARLGWRCSWQAPSRVPGPAGNVEFFVALGRGLSNP